ncbi:hypothetical protein EBF03_07920 [Arcanobacterium haemolyticum]|uniref:Uncharacterized protein n=1 Tax=Arcanobacterium haemolyticum (strain ATCC 9345 / DSM 20595 / CCM 5947 / CCUG 17215 / LMG 16163 / NBRC 15585 / NCTC 8452 / 11018) TaxID=644284 RepID=D7BKX0_ARCHD|nr:hypothetical protein [Arcanobacterium haemolyticum]ADH93300.1 hypothetical protein Arch_1613 [Arcanobacterium haemolyticum DSM 20595]QCX47331.1 hypothetical protein EBF03_07920 [Arcanobacterium haemolyticum]SQH27867.1 Uncharacterised protein [Arcanobacterium haemolyticum]
MTEKRGRRVVRLSRLDAGRLERGDIATPEEALHNTDAGPVLSKPTGFHTPAQAYDPHEKELIENVPPHFGKL